MLVHTPYTLGVYETVISARYYVFSCLTGQCQGRIGPLLPGGVRKWARLGQNSPRPPSAQHAHPSAHPEPPHINAPHLILNSHTIANPHFLVIAQSLRVYLKDKVSRDAGHPFINRCADTR